ncbi:DinB family protein [Salsipaludibacter albus]|uniref:DinB family protein n=1 Tax=Salsipaludibacter albus TaxID=2849650 RepID=UPI001EE4BBDB
MIVEDPRADERTTLTQSLDLQRAIFRWKCRGLDRAGMTATREPSTLHLAGLAKHLAVVEEGWFADFFAGEDSSSPWADVDWDADEDWDFTSAADDDPAALMGWLDAACERSRAIVADTASLDQLSVRENVRGHVSLRWILVHMIEEYARHNGHADLLREGVDGATGDLPPEHPLH